MADLEGLKVAKDYHIDTPFANQDGFYVKGANSLDWGNETSLQIFQSKEWKYCNVCLTMDTLWEAQQD